MAPITYTSLYLSLLRRACARKGIRPSWLRSTWRSRRLSNHFIPVVRRKLNQDSWCSQALRMASGTCTRVDAHQWERERRRNRYLKWCSQSMTNYEFLMRNATIVEVWKMLIVRRSDTIYRNVLSLQVVILEISRIRIKYKGHNLYKPYAYSCRYSRFDSRKDLVWSKCWRDSWLGCWTIILANMWKIWIQISWALPCYQVRLCYATHL